MLLYRRRMTLPQFADLWPELTKRRQHDVGAYLVTTARHRLLGAVIAVQSWTSDMMILCERKPEALIEGWNNADGH